MGKRSDGTFERVERDFYPTPIKAVLPLLPHLAPGTRFIEPCAGDGRLIDHIESEAGHKCVGAYDIDPEFGWMIADAMTSDYRAHQDTMMFITNPPWDRKLLHPIIDNLSAQAPTWLLFDNDWASTVQAKPYLEYCHKIVSIGRVKWIEDSKHTGKDNASWYLFDQAKRHPGYSEFYGR